MSATADETTTTETWPPLPYSEWKDTLQTLHMWTQIVGKIKLELAPYLNEWWQVALHYTASGMTTGLIPYGDRMFDMTFDFLDHALVIQTLDGPARAIVLSSRTVADFYREVLDALDDLGIQVAINPVPSEVVNPIACDVNETDSSYDPDFVNRWWRIQVQTERILQRYRSWFVGKSSPIHFYWGSFDLNHSRFSGRPAPVAEGMPRFFQLAEDQENVSCGFWPGNTNFANITYGEPAFYSYIYPAPAGYAEASVRTQAAYYDTTLGEFVLRYEDVRQADSPDQALLEFFQSTYEAAADLAGWDRSALEHEPPA